MNWRSSMRWQRGYDLPTAITFLMAGLGIGSLLAVILSPRSKSFSLPTSSRLQVDSRTSAL